MTGRTDAVVLLLPGADDRRASAASCSARWSPPGAFAAFLSTSSGLTVSVAGVLGQDMLRGGVRGVPGRGACWRRRAARCWRWWPAALPVADVVGLAFAVAASSFCPLLVLGIWWRRLTDVGAAAGCWPAAVWPCVAVLLTIGGGGLGRTGSARCWPSRRRGRCRSAFAVMVVVSLLTRHRIPAGRGPHHGAAARSGGARPEPLGTPAAPGRAARPPRTARSPWAPRATRSPLRPLTCD